MTGTPTARRAAVTVAVAALLVVSGCTSAFGGTSGSDDSAEIGFENVTQEVGLDYAGTGTGAGNGNAGVYTADVDNDGWEDLLAIGDERPALYRNTGGEFERSGALPSLDRPFKSAAFVDYDGDGWRDLLLFAHDGDAVALHNDEGTFERDEVGLDNFTYPLGATVADYDGDGDRDLFVYQSGDWAHEKPDGYFSANRSIRDDNGNPNVLYENTGDGFERVDAPGIEGDRWSLAASFVDLTGDGAPDIHVANDYNNDTIYLNQGDGTFEQRQLGGATARNGMASEIGDVNRDGRPDVFVTNIDIPVSRENMSADRYDRLARFLEYVIHSGRTEGNTMLVNEGDGAFDDQAPAYGVREGGWGWAASFADFDNDGDRDLLHTTQVVVRLDTDNPVYSLPMIWEREGDDFDRLNASARGFAEHDGRGMVTMDYDRDGDQDVVIASYYGDFAVYENTAEDADAVQFEVVDENGATALGATATVEAGDTETAVWQNARTGYLSQESPVTHVGTGDAETVTLSVTWPDGEEASYEVDPNARYRVAPDGVETVANLTSGD